MIDKGRKIEELESDGAADVKNDAAEVGNEAGGGDDLMKQIDELLAAAEHAGYMKARNEMAEALMKRPRLWENVSLKRVRDEQKSAGHAAPDDGLSSGFLKRVRHGEWD